MRGVAGLAAWLTLGAAIALSGCASPPQTIIENPAYPGDRQQGPTLDIQVVRDGTRISLTNTTARNFGPFTLWLNRRFARELPGLAVGQSLELGLAEFQDQWGDRFRAGGFFATERPERLAKAEIDLRDGSPLLGLVVIRGEE